MSSLGNKMRGRNGKKPAKGSRVFKPGLRSEPTLNSSLNHSVWGLSSRSQYQRQLCALEMELSQLREDLEDLRHNCSSIDLAREHYLELYHGSPVCFLTMNTLGYVLECNIAFENLIGSKLGPNFLFSRLICK